MATGSGTLRQLTLRGQDAAVAVIDVAGGTLTLDGCEVAAAAKAALAVCGASAAVWMRHGRIRNSAGLGVVISDGATGTFERTVIEHVGSDGVTISSGADPAFSECTISDVKGIGVAARDNARGVVAGCEIPRITRAGGAVCECSSTRMTSARLHDTPEVGGLGTSGARPRLSECGTLHTGPRRTGLG